MAPPTSGTDAAAVSQPVTTPLSRAAIFLVVTINPHPDSCSAVRSFCADFSALVRAIEFRDIEAGFAAYWESGPKPGIGCSGIRARPSFIRSGRSGPERATRSRPPATCCYIFAPGGWTSASRWRCRSWRGSAKPYRWSTRFTAFAISTTATSWASSTAPRIRAARKRPKPRSSEARTPRSSAAAT